MSKYDGLIIPRSYNEYINKSDPATLKTALQQNNVLATAVESGNTNAVTSGAVYSNLNEALADYTKNMGNYSESDLLARFVELSANGDVNRHGIFYDTTLSAWATYRITVFKLSDTRYIGDCIIGSVASTTLYRYYINGTTWTKQTLAS